MSNNIFSIGVSGLNAAQWGLTTTGQNISNASTPGYSLEKVEYQEASGQYTNAGYLGNGVQSVTVSRSYSQYLTTQLNNTQSTSSAANTYYTLISQLNNLVGDPTKGIGAGISSYFSGMQSVANAAGTTSARQVLVSSAQTLADQITTAGSQYDQLRQSVNTQLTSAVTQINSYTQQIADLNKQINIASAQGQPPNQLLDQRDLAVQNLSSMVGVQVMQTDGNYNVFIGNGQPLVVGGTQYGLQAVTSASDPSELSIAFKSADGSTQTPAQINYHPGFGALGRHCRRPAQFPQPDARPGAGATRRDRDQLRRATEPAERARHRPERQSRRRAVLRRQPDDLRERAQHGQRDSRRHVRRSDPAARPATTRFRSTARSTRCRTARAARRSTASTPPRRAARWAGSTSRCRAR